jgi:multicomponent Na+:H+ antiporter subunit G
LLTAIEAIAIALGVFFMFLSSVGVLRLPDFYSRLHAPTKAATLGLFFLFIAVAIGVPEKVVVTKALLALIFIAATAPVGAHIMSRAAYRSGVKPGPGTVVDEYAAVVEVRKMIEGTNESTDVKLSGETAT